MPYPLADADLVADEIELDRQLSVGTALRQTGHTIDMSALVHGTGTDRDVLNRAHLLREEIRISGVRHPHRGP
ncbi:MULTISPECIES: hypothetical protein [Streptomyces]|uniref:hypothetical protein n=1 Tax=Streptomyces TaxID=1883 RepID=UPI001601BAB6|nr:hypothetical protein [Streptomyces murinus]MBA9050364.1 hypothetical protein [Streptomyces murinus]